jgi:hypothetical protein
MLLHFIAHHPGGTTAMNSSSSCSRNCSLSMLRPALAAGLLLIRLAATASAQPAHSWTALHDEGGYERAGCPGCETSYLGVAR